MEHIVNYFVHGKARGDDTAVAKPSGHPNWMSFKTAWQRLWQRPPASLLSAVAVACAVSTLPWYPFVEAVERKTQDLRFHWRGPIETKTRIVIAELDAKTENAWQTEPMVFWTGHYADIIENAKKARARAVAFDMIPVVSGKSYLEDQVGHPLDDSPDERFADAIQEADPLPVVFAVQRFGEGRDGIDVLAKPIEPAPVYMQIPEVAANLGFIDLPASPDDVVRESLRSTRALGGGAPLPGFPALVAARAAGNRGEAIPEIWTGDPTRTNPQPSFYVDNTLNNYADNSRGHIEHISASDLAAGKSADLKGAIVLVGWTAPDSTDWHMGPDRRHETGVELQAQAIATLLDHRELRRWSTLGESLVTLLIGLAATLLTSAIILTDDGQRVRLGIEATLLALVSVAWVGLAYSEFVGNKFLLPVVAPLCALTLPCLTFRAVHAAAEWWERQQVEADYGRYASVPIMRHLKQYPDLGPETKDVSVLFLDIRGSTRYAESRKPTDVMRELNELFQAIVKVIDDNDGLLYRYTGDGFLAVFGAPITSDRHAANALRCARQLLDETHKFNQIRAATGQMAWSVGCSVNSGEAAAGKIGTTGRSDYSVIGDVVNLAAKIESLNKADKNEAGRNKPETDLVITVETWEGARDVAIELQSGLIDHGWREVPGRTQMAYLYFYRLHDPIGDPNSAIRADSVPTPVRIDEPLTESPAPPAATPSLVGSNDGLYDLDDSGYVQIYS